MVRAKYFSTHAWGTENLRRHFGQLTENGGGASLKLFACFLFRHSIVFQAIVMLISLDLCRRDASRLTCSETQRRRFGQGSEADLRGSVGDELPSRMTDREIQDWLRNIWKARSATWGDGALCLCPDEG